MTSRLDRRAFLRTLAAAGALPLADQTHLIEHSTALGGEAAAAAVPARAGRDDSPAGTPVSSGSRVVVLGAGLAGLGAAYNLMKRGHHVIVLEAQDRPGGRVQTHRDGFQRGGFAELGAVRIFETHEYTLKYIDEFGLELTPYDTGSRAFSIQDQRFLEPAEGEPWPMPGLTPEEQADPFALFPKYVESGFEKLGDLTDPAWPETVPSALELDRTTMDGFMGTQGASRTWRDWFYAQNGRIARINAATGFAVEALAEGESVTSITGGNDQLPYAMAAALGDRVKYGSEVVGISQDDQGVTISFMDGDGQQQLTADRCVCALPFAPLRRVQLDANFSQEKLEAIDTLEYMPAARCFFQTRSQFWQDDPLGPLGGLNLVGTDTMAGRVWNTSSQQPDQSTGMLMAYMFDTEALAFASYGDHREGAMRQLFGRLLPGIDDQITGTAQKVWQEDPWAGGGWGWAQPNDLAWMLPTMRRPEGRVHFAGEHTSLWIAWMNGALESAERVVEEIAQAAA